MTPQFAEAMRQATQATRTQDLAGATRLIQQALNGRAPEKPSAQPEEMATGSRGFRIDPDAETIEPNRFFPKRSLGDVIRRLHEGKAALNLGELRPDALKLRPRASVSVPEGAQFLSLTHSGPAGSRAYRLYIPASLTGDPCGLVVMLHGCTQNPEDFAIGTRMNEVAEANGMLVAYPEQENCHNSMGCWNWFRPGDQQAHTGEPAILAALAGEIAARYNVPEGRIFAAGLSAGGAMAAILGTTHPDVFAAAGIHSGLPPGSASDLISAFSAMRGEAGAPRTARQGKAIIFHGTADRTVHPSNGERIFEATCDPAARTQSSEGRNWTREVTETAEIWRISGLGHAWSGGDPRGSYTEAGGPDASAEMVRFFLKGAAQ